MPVAQRSALQVAIIGGGWAGLAAAVAAFQAGHQVCLFEAARTLGGRARRIEISLPDGRRQRLDNGQHILIGAYVTTLRLLRQVGLDPESALLRLPLTLQFPDGGGLQLAQAPAPWDVLAGVLRARGWRWSERLALLQRAWRWRRHGFVCAAQTSVAELCAGLPLRVQHELIEPLCLSALNTPPAQASAELFLRVLQDSLFAAPGGSNLLLPRVDLSVLWPEAAARWLHAASALAASGVPVGDAGLRGGRAQVLTGRRIESLRWQPTHWQVDGQRFDRVILALDASNAALVLANTAQNAIESGANLVASSILHWLDVTGALHFSPIATVYAQADGVRLAQPLLALRSQGPSVPAQFVFDRGQLGGPPGLLAFVVSASQGDKATLEAAVLAQARDQLGLQLLPLQTLIEKRATFACTPGLLRPAQRIAPNLLACGDYCAGPYPATLEGALRSGWAAGGWAD